MTGYAGHKALDEYRWTDLPSLVDGGNPHELVQVMLDGAVTRLMQAEGALENGDIPLKCELISKALNLVQGLQACLDVEQGGEIAQNLEALYEYMGRRLVAANAFNDSSILKEVASLLRELQTGWREMGQLLDDRQAASDQAATAS